MQEVRSRASGDDSFADPQDPEDNVPLQDIPQAINVGVGGGSLAGGGSIGGATVASTVLGMNTFRAVDRTVTELKQSKVAVGRNHRGLEGSKTNLAIRKMAVTSTTEMKLVSHLSNGNKNAQGESGNKNLQEGFVSNLLKVQNLIEHFVLYDLAYVLAVPDSYDPSEADPLDQWMLNDPNFSVTEIHLAWAKMSLDHVCAWQSFINRRGSVIDIESSNWLQELLSNCVNADLKKKVKEKFDLLSPFEQGGISYWKILMDIVFKMSSLTIQTLKEYLKSFGIAGLKGELGQDVRKVGILILAVCARLADKGALEYEAYKNVIAGLAKCDVFLFATIYRQKAGTVEEQDAIHGYGGMSSDDVLKQVEELNYAAMTIYDNMVTAKKWIVPGRGVNSLNHDFKPKCDNCGGEHFANECPHPRDDERCKKARQERAASNKSQGGGGRGGGKGKKRGGRGGGQGEQGTKRGQWTSGSDGTNAASSHQGLEFVDGQLLMSCKKCGLNTTHTSGYHDEHARYGANFSLPATHPYNMKMAEQASVGGKPIVDTGASRGVKFESNPSVKGQLKTLIDSRMSLTENSEMAAFYSDLKGMLSGN